MPSDLLQKLIEIIEADPRIQPAGAPIAVSLDADGSVTLEGEVATVASKRVAYARVSRLPDVFSVVDHLRVASERLVDDEQIRRRLLDLLFEDPCFEDYELCGSTAGQGRARQTSGKQALRIDLDVTDGVVSLSGRVRSPLHKLLAGVLAWWTPGSRDVRNGLALEAQDAEGVRERDAEGDREIEDAVRTALERDPLLERALEVSVRDCVVILRGAVASDEERSAAEADAWYVTGVRDVVNELSIEA
jgi:osmotically-inducible protein OsmY